jgi:general secretion pathway protein H
MRGARPGHSGSALSQCGAAGFTLLELMVVILIIGIMATLVMLSVGNRGLDDRLELESKRMTQLMQLAEDEADLKGQPIGLRFGDDGYRFVTVDNTRKWVDYAQGGALRPRALMQPFYADLRVEGRPVPPAVDKPASSGTKSKDEKDEGLKPQILLLPGGQMTAFTLDLRAPNYPSYFHIEGDVLGRITRERRYDR